METCDVTSQKEVKKTPAGKVMLAYFWDAQRPILEDYQKRGTTINSVRYSEMLHDQLNQ
jgi:hypothetical protein